MNHAFNEISKTVALGTRVLVSGTEVPSGFPLRATDGSVTQPSYSFQNATSSGLYILASGNMLMSSAAQNTWCASSLKNFAVGSDFPVFNGSAGSGVLFLAQASTLPAGIPNGGSGGILYVDGTYLHYLDATGTALNLTSITGDVLGPASSVNDTLAQFSGTSGTIIANATSFRVTYSPDSIQLNVANSPGAPVYSFESDSTTGMYSPAANQLAFSTASTRRLHISTSTVTTDGNVLLANGTNTTPSLSFTAGGIMFKTGTSPCFGAMNLPALCVAPSNNIAVCGPLPGNFGTGDGVLLVNQATAPPTSATTGGVSVYVEGSSLKMMTTGSATPIDFTDRINGPASSTDNAVVRTNGTSGTLVKNSVVTVADGGQVSVPVGSALAPSFSFVSDPISGLYSKDGGTYNSLVCLTGGTEAVGIQDNNKISVANRFQSSNGTQAAPGMALVAQADTGFFLVGASGIGCGAANSTCCVVSPLKNISLAGPEATTYGSGSGLIFINQAATNPAGNPNNAGLLFIDDSAVNSLLFKASNGTQTPLSNILNGPNTAVTRTIAKWTDTTGTVVLDTNFVVSAAGELLAGNGSLGAPTYSFIGDLTSGITLISEANLGCIISGTSIINVGSSTVSLSQPLVNHLGLLATPSLSFTSDISLGLFSPGADSIQAVSNSAVAFTLAVVNNSPNVTLCSANTDYGGTTAGEKVVLLDDVGVAPSGSAASGGRLYVSGTSLFYHDYFGATIDLFSVTPAAVSSTNLAIALFNGAAGLMKNSLNLTTNGTTTLRIPTGGQTTPGFSFTSSSTSGLYPSGATIGVTSAGGLRLNFTSSVNIGANVPLHTDTSLIIGTSGLNLSLSGANYIQNITTAGGLYTWTNTSGTIMSTTSALALSITNKLLLTEASDTLTVGYDGTEFSFAATGTPQNFTFRSAGSSKLTVASTGASLAGTATITGRMLVLGNGLSSPYDYNNSSFTNRGLSRSSAQMFIGFGVTRSLVFLKNNCMQFGSSSDAGLGSTVSGIIFLIHSSGHPVTQTALNLKLYSQPTTGIFGFGALTNTGRTVFDGPRERATITLSSFTVADSTATNTDGQVWTLVNGNGVNGTTTGALVTSDDVYATIIVNAQWVSDPTGYRRIRIMRKTAGPTYTAIVAATKPAISGVTTNQTLSCFLSVVNATDEITVEVFQNSTGNLNVDLTMSYIRFGTLEPV